ncbi:MAG: biotin transporter BioY [Oscillospiraceae bacterium]|jgi:biotin transport system substrate-specific component|nr:biotin transporter BioY [Oscillospiraceae bacterium]
MSSNVQNITKTAVFAALICVVAPFSVPIGAIPISLATLAVYLAAGTLGKKLGTLAVAVYILIGAVGLPVFSGFGSGLPKLLGVTGGFIVGYIPLAFITGCFSGSNVLRPIGMVLGTIALYALGTIWFMLTTNSGVVYSLTVCVLPFLLGDAAKIVIASALSPALTAALSKLKPAA